MAPIERVRKSVFWSIARLHNFFLDHHHRTFKCLDHGAFNENQHGGTQRYDTNVCSGCVSSSHSLLKLQALLNLRIASVYLEQLSADEHNLCLDDNARHPGSAVLGPTMIYTQEENCHQKIEINGYRRAAIWMVNVGGGGRRGWW